MKPDNAPQSTASSILDNKVLRVTGAITGFIAAIATIIVTLQSFLGSRPEIEVRLMESELLTKKANVKDLVSTYTYNGKPVSSLWRCRIGIANVGNKNIIGNGKHSDLINNTLPIKFNSNFNLVKIETVKGTSLPIAVTFGPNNLDFKFDQWLTDEKIELVCYFINNIPSNKFEIPSTQSRSIENGEITIVNKITSAEKPAVLIDLLTQPIPLIARILSVLLCITALIVFITIMATEIPSYSKMKRYWEWDVKYRTEYDNYIKTLPNEEAMKFIFSNYGTFGPDKLPKPPRIEPAYKTRRGAFFILFMWLVGVISVFACLACIIKF